ncbi:GerMN domain-containing protein [Virgibacillus sp. W0181]|uniref:GerMN domain-containing protein n=1 Tax=Virgibacillus sp. W0181 TaxID=3391581 RepID=UPI003F448E00
MKRRVLLLLCLPTMLALLLAGCFQGEQSMEEIDTPPDAEAVDQQESESDSDGEKVVNKETDDDEQATETVPRQLYLLDANGMVAAQTVELPKLESKEVATQVLSYLVKDGPVMQILPNGFEAVLPAGTEVLGLNLQDDGSLVVDVSNEFANYKAEDELKILQAMTYTLTQFENVERIKLWVNGEPQTEMPVNGTPITEGYSRTNGINIINTDTLDLLTSEPVTMYYPAEFNENRYFVPVTQYVEGNNKENYDSIVESLLKGPMYDTNILHVFNSKTSLINKPVLKDGILELVFNESILKDPEKKIISDEVVETLVRTLTEQQDIDAVQIKVENTNELVNENGEIYAEPVTNKTFSITETL